MFPAPDEHPSTPELGQSALRAALLALGVGALWATLSRWRRRRPSDLW